jgi:hypothetical protein
MHLFQPTFAVAVSDYGCGPRIGQITEAGFDAHQLAVDTEYCTVCLKFRADSQSYSS